MKKSTEEAIAIAVVVLLFALVYFAPSLGISFTQSKELYQSVTSSTESQVPVIIFTSLGPVKTPTQSIYALAEQNVMAISFHLMTVYNFQAYRYIPLFGVAAGYIPKDQIQSAYADPQVISIDYDLPITVPKFSSTSGGTVYLTLGEVAAMDNVSVLWDNGWDGQGVKVAYIDSGAPASASIEALSVDNMYPGDQYGHGSMVYDVIHTLAPQSNIVSIKVLDASGNGRISSVMEGLQLAVLSNSNVVNMSLGTPVGTFDSLSQACRLTSQIYGIKIFAASGNVGEQGTLSPAISSEVVSVGAVDSNLQVDYYSSRGKVDTSAFGDINAMWLNSPSNISGTSCASPQVAALYTDWLSGHPTVDAGRIDQFAVMKSASVSLGQSTSATGWGLLAGQALAQTEPTYSPTLIERLELPIILLSIVLIIIALIAVAGRRR